MIFLQLCQQFLTSMSCFFVVVTSSRNVYLSVFTGNFGKRKGMPKNFELSNSKKASTLLRLHKSLCNTLAELQRQQESTSFLFQQEGNWRPEDCNWCWPGAPTSSPSPHSHKFFKVSRLCWRKRSTAPQDQMSHLMAHHRRKAFPPSYTHASLTLCQTWC